MTRIVHLEAAADEAFKLNASFDYQITEKHVVATVGIAGKMRKIFMSKTPKDRSATAKVRCKIRRVIKEMRE